MSLHSKQIDFSEKWISLQETLKSVLTLNYVPKILWNQSFEDIYFVSVAIPNVSHKLYDHTKMFLEKHVLKLLSIVQTENTSNFLRIYLRYWKKYSKGVKYLQDLYQ